MSLINQMKNNMTTTGLHHEAILSLLKANRFEGYVYVTLHKWPEEVGQ